VTSANELLKVACVNCKLCGSLHRAALVDEVMCYSCAYVESGADLTARLSRYIDSAVQASPTSVDGFKRALDEFNLLCDAAIRENGRLPTKFRESANPADVVAHAAKHGIATVVGIDGKPKVHVDIPTRDLQCIDPLDIPYTAYWSRHGVKLKATVRGVNLEIGATLESGGRTDEHIVEIDHNRGLYKRYGDEVYRRFPNMWWTHEDVSWELVHHDPRSDWPRVSIVGPLLGEPSSAADMANCSSLVEASKAVRAELAKDRPADPLDVEYDGVKLRTLIEKDRENRQDEARPGLGLGLSGRNNWFWSWTPAQRAAVSAHWSAQLRAKVAAAKKADRNQVTYCEED